MRLRRKKTRPGDLIVQNSRLRLSCSWEARLPDDTLVLLPVGTEVILAPSESGGWRFA